MIPACHYAVIDEAHQLEDVATQYFGVSISPRRFERLIRDARRYIDRDLEHKPEEAQPVRAVIDLAERYAEIFFGEAQMRLSSIDRTRIDPDMLAPVAESGHRLASTLRSLDAPLAHITERSQDLRSQGRRAGA